MQKGIFISFEGPDGSGKSSVIQALKHPLADHFDCPVHYTREPGGSPIAEDIRRVMLDPQHTAMDERTEALLFAASRRQHVTEMVIPALEKGEVVVSDRYVDSSIAYQGYGREIGPEAIYQINHFAINQLWPDLTLYIDVPAEVGLQRIEQNRHPDQINRLDQEKLEFHRRVRQGYLELLERFSERMLLVQGDQDFDQVVADCLAIITKHFPKGGKQ